MDIDEVIVYNRGHNGDIHFSREFFKFLQKHLPIKIVYKHRMKTSVIGDVHYIHEDFESFIKIFCEQRQIYLDEASYQMYFKENSKLYINFWPGVKNFYYFHNVSSAEIPTVMHTFYKFWNDMCDELKQYGFFLPMPPIDKMIPSIDFCKFDIIRNLNLRSLNVLLSNGNVLSSQSDNFSFDRILDRLSKEFPFCNFYITAQSSIDSPNVIDVNKIYTKENCCNLNEIGYLSTFCDVIVGRQSGPYNFALNTFNIYDTNKSFIEILNHGIRPVINQEIFGENKIAKYTVIRCEQNLELLQNNIYNTIASEIKEKFYKKFFNT